MHAFDMILYETARFDKITDLAEAAKSAVSSALRDAEQDSVNANLVHGIGPGLSALRQLQEMRTELKELRLTVELHFSVQEERLRVQCERIVAMKVSRDGYP